MKILFDGRMIGPSSHGIARYALDLLTEIAKTESELTVLTYFSDFKKTLGDSGTIKENKCNSPFASPKESIELTAKTFGKAYDAFFFPSFSVPLVLPKTSFVVVHDLIHLSHYNNPLHQIYFKTIFNSALRRAAGIITVSESSKSQLVEILGISPGKIKVIRNGLAPEWFDSPRTIKPLTPFFITLGNPKPHKNLITVIRTCQMLWRDGLDFNLKLSLGGAPLPNHWGLSKIERNRIEFLENISDQSLRELYWASSALISPSLVEGFDYPIAEALACQTPVIASDASAKLEFKSPLISFFGPPENVGGLAELMKSHLIRRPETGRVSHNVGDRKQMAKETVDYINAQLTD